jgi:hypothetical protein
MSESEPGPSLNHGTLNRGLCLLVVCRRSLVEVDEAVHEKQVMRDAIAIFRDVYEEIDAAERLIYSASG